MKDNWWQVRGEAAHNPHGQGHPPFLIHIHIQKQVETVMPRKGQRPMLDPTCTYVEGVGGLNYITSLTATAPHTPTKPT